MLPRFYIRSILFFPPFLLNSLLIAEPSPQNATVQVSVTDLRSAPVAAQNGLTDELQQTQLLYGERVRIYESSGVWVRVEAIDQPSFKYHQKWEGYPGWVLAAALTGPAAQNAEGEDLTAIPIQTKWAAFSTAGLSAPIGALSMGAYVKPVEKACLVSDCDPVPVPFTDGTRHLTMSSKDLIQPTYACRSDDPLCEVSSKRRTVVLAARQLYGVPYQWGGLTPAGRPMQGLTAISAIRGIDCSGLVHLAYRVNGMKVPRDSLEQWMKATPIRRAKLQSGDLVFSARAANPKKIVHVTIYAGRGLLIEAPQTGLTVRQISFEEKFGAPLGTVESGQTVGDRVVYFGSFL